MSTIIILLLTAFQMCLSVLLFLFVMWFIPYDELDKITVIRKDGTTEDIISDGRFVLVGIEELNKPLDR